MVASVCICLYVMYFSFLYLFSCLLINAHWYIHFGFHIISLYLVSVPLFKGHRVLVHNCSFVCLQIYLFRDGSSGIFDYFVLSPLVFLINFVTDTSLMLKYETKKNKTEHVEYTFFKHNLTLLTNKNSASYIIITTM